MCFILCDANAVNERAWVRDTQQKPFLGRMGKRGEAEITKRASLMSSVQKWEAVPLQPLFLHFLLEQSRTQKEDKEVPDSTGGRWCSVKPRVK